MVEMLEKCGWRVGPEEIRRAISDDLRDNIPIFMPPEHQQLLKERREEQSERSHRDLDEQRAERDKAIDPAHVAARSSDAPVARYGRRSKEVEVRVALRLSKSD